jgi:hypothetical protein
MLYFINVRKYGQKNIDMSNNKQARYNFLQWFFKSPTSRNESIIDTMMEELEEDGRSVWTFQDLVDCASGTPEHILQELKYADRLDDEMRADAEAQDYETFGDNKI